MQTFNVRDILRSKPANSILSVTPSAKVIEALRLMAEKGVGALLVMEGDKLCGIVSERDYARKVALMERSSRTAAISEIMTANVITVTPEDSVEHCMNLMTDRRLRHLPVIEKGLVIGMVSIGDLVKGIISSQAFTIRQLESYIKGEIN